MLLNQRQIDTKIKFIEDYKKADNAANGAKLDPNANVTNRNIATLASEIHKDINIQINRELMVRKLTEMYGEEVAEQYIYDLKSHLIYAHDESGLQPYCVSISMYPFLLEGLIPLGGESGPPKHLESFCGSFVNLIFAISSQFVGAVATVEFLTHFDHFARADYGEDYLENHEQIVKNHLEHVVYAINQPAAARGFQSAFWNISVFDEHYFKHLFDNFIYPDGSSVSWDSVRKLQKYFLQWFNKERSRALLTFPVVTAAFLNDGENPLDEDFNDTITKELSEGNSFFMYLSDSVDSLASCCRLRNEYSDNTFSYTLGAGGVATGSINVITINMNRLTQWGVDLRTQVEKVHKYQLAYRKLIEEYLQAGMLPAYEAGFISLDKQFLTIGINGLVEAAEFLGIEPSNNDRYKVFASTALGIIFNANKQKREETGILFNTEFVPAENLGVKFAKWDKADGLVVNRDCYNSYFFPVESNIDFPDKFVLHGKEINQYLDGGSALHLNLGEYPTQEGYRKLINIAIKTGTNYFCTNVAVTCCNECGFIDKNTERTCTKCGSSEVTHATRIIGYLKKIDYWSTERQQEHARREYNSVLCDTDVC